MAPHYGKPTQPVNNTVRTKKVIEQVKYVDGVQPTCVCRFRPLPSLLAFCTTRK